MGSRPGEPADVGGAMGGDRHVAGVSAVRERVEEREVRVRAADAVRATCAPPATSATAPRLADDVQVELQPDDGQQEGDAELGEELELPPGSTMFATLGPTATPTAT